ncbi:hypothetical protein Tco_0139224 [Tanacetum coccineum]
MASTRASISKASKRPKINIIPPKQLFVDLTQDDTKTPSPKLQLSSPSAPSAPSKTPSTKDTSSSSIDYIPKSPTSSTSLSPNASDEELEELMKDQPLSADASPTALSPGYIADSNPEEDKEDPEEDPADHPADG